MKLPLLITLLWVPILSVAAQATPCGCVQDFDFTVNYLERNLPAFQDAVTPKTQRSYGQFKQQLRRAIVADPVPGHCIRYLMRYVSFFHDSHTAISGNPTSGPPVKETDAAAVAAFQASPLFQTSERIRLSPLNYVSGETIEGRYRTPDSTYTIQIQRNKTSLRDYVGVIVTSRTPLWQPGQVKLELQRNPDGRTFHCYQYQRNHALQAQPVVWLEYGRLRNTTWQKADAPALPPPATPQAHFQQLDATTAYLRIPSFGSTWTTRLDSLYRHAQPAIEQSQNLILDVRDNGGGADQNVEPLIPFFTSGPFQDDQQEEYYVTPANIERFTEYLHTLQQDSAQVGATTLQHTRQKLAWLRQAPLNQFVPDPAITGRRFTSPARANPKQVVILYNQGCSSSCETLLFWAKNSTKTKLVGEPSGGYVGYGNVFSVRTPCLQFQLNATTLRLPNQLQYEGKGVTPTVRLHPDEDWLAQTMRLLKQN
jgi:hypothetical protein